MHVPGSTATRYRDATGCPWCEGRPGGHPRHDRIHRHRTRFVAARRNVSRPLGGPAIRRTNGPVGSASRPAGGPQSGPQLERHKTVAEVRRRLISNLALSPANSSALAWQARGRRFESAMLHQKIKFKLRTAVPPGAAVFVPERVGALKKALNACARTAPPDKHEM